MTKEQMFVMSISSIRSNPKTSWQWVVDGMYVNDMGKLSGVYAMPYQKIASMYFKG